MERHNHWPVAIQSIATIHMLRRCCTTLSFELSPLTEHMNMNRNPPLSSVQLAQPPEEANNNTFKEMLSTAGDLAKTVADLTTVVADILQNVPYVKGIAGTLAQIIKIRDVTLILLD